MPLGKLGKYEKLDVLGHGVSGIVYLAWDTLLGKHVAIKEISLQAADEARFLEEARVLDRLHHPNIVRVNSVDKIDGRLIIDMEYVKGTNLHEYMRKRVKVPAREALTIAVQIADALDFAHRNHIVHRDVKPANVMLSRDGEVKIGDFGLAEILGSGSYAGGAGTYAYMAPEDFEEQSRSDHRADVWAVGVTLYEMLAGKRPFQAAKPKDPFSWKRAVDEDIPQPLTKIDPSLPPELDKVMEYALAKNKPDRYQTAGELRDDLRAVLASIGGPAVCPVSEAAPEDSSGPQSLSDDIRVMVEPDEIDFGSVRRGGGRVRKFTIRAIGGSKTEGRLVSQPAWVAVTPQVFKRRKQTFHVNAIARNVWNTGPYADNLMLEIDGSTVSVPVSMNVIPARRRFYQVFWWYIPLLFASLLPVLSQESLPRALGGEGNTAALAASALLSAMLTLIAVVADLGVLEKLLPAAMGAFGMGAVLGSLYEVVSRTRVLEPHEAVPMSIVGTMLSLVIAIQLLTSSRWKIWSFGLIIASILSTIGVLTLGT